jgi:hypothetical protein
MDRIMVKETLDVDERTLASNLQDVIDSLKYYQSQGWQGLQVNYCGDYMGFELYKERPETDTEYNNRLKSEKLSKERRRQKYEELKKEFE